MNSQWPTCMHHAHREGNGRSVLHKLLQLNGFQLQDCFTNLCLRLHKPVTVCNSLPNALQVIYTVPIIMLHIVQVCFTKPQNAYIDCASICASMLYKATFSFHTSMNCASISLILWASMLYKATFSFHTSMNCACISLVLWANIFFNLPLAFTPPWTVPLYSEPVCFNIFFKPLHIRSLV